VSGAFLDTNILIYAFSTGPRSHIARRLLDGGNVIAVQSLSEFAAVARRKLKLGWAELNQSLASLQQLCRLIEARPLELHRRGLQIAERYQLGVFDSMLIAAALSAGCRTFLSEDMHDGLVVESVLTIRNPFLDEQVQN